MIVGVGEGEREWVDIWPGWGWVGVGLGWGWVGLGWAGLGWVGFI